MQVILIVCALAALGLSSAANQCSAVNDIIIGNDFIAQVTGQSPQDCCDACHDNGNCVAFTFDEPSKMCFLKDNLQGNTSHPGRISGTNGRTPVSHFNACMPPYDQFPFCDTSKSLDDRLNDLVSRIELNETGAQLTARESSSITALGLPSYYWGTNAIHGLQNVNCLSNGQCPTSFPAPNALSATFNMSIVHEMGRIIGREMRAYFNGNVHNSLDSWSPTINPSRDPRWGRNVESPGESPFVCGRYGAAYTQGIQYGDDPNVLQAVVTLKHWVAYSLENYDGVTRHTFDAIVSEYDLQDTYLVGWNYVMKTAKPLGVMCSYNMLNGKPTCGNPDLTAILRNDFNFEGYITSDSDSIRDIWNSHHYEKTAPEAVRDGVNAGCDIDSGSTYKDNIEPAVNLGLVNQSMVKNCLYRSYKMRFLTGQFDPKVPNANRNISTKEVGQMSSQQHSLFGARKAMTLLKNDNNVLPFPKGGKVAVLGVSSNSSEDLLGNYLGPICPSGKYECVPTVYNRVSALNGAPTSLVDDASKVQEAVSAAQAADRVVLTISNAADGGGEGHDRYTISLADDQLAFVKAVLAVGKPTVIVSINGGLISLDEIKDLAPAILIVFAPGTHGAQAIAETVFGDNNPGGKLPVTMYPSNFTSQSDFLNMSMQAGPGRSYRYYTGTPLYPFGFGLSYTTFSVSWSPAPPAPTIFSGTKASTTYTATVKNTGSRAGDEVVFAYFKPSKSSLKTLDVANPVPISQLFGFERVSLEAGAETTVSFTLNASDLSLATLSGHREIHAGDFEIVIHRGHGAVLAASVQVKVDSPVRLLTFRKWW